MKCGHCRCYITAEKQKGITIIVVPRRSKSVTRNIFVKEKPNWNKNG